MRAVDQVSFEIHAGEALGLVGESGSGKTTVGRAVLQLIPASAGVVMLNGVDLRTISSSRRRESRRHMQIIFQDPAGSLNPRMKVGEIVGEPLRVHGMARGNDLRRRVADLLTQCGLWPAAAERRPHEFSGGQRQRVAIARALALEPRVIICDEPTSALDVSVQAQILNLLHDLQVSRGLAYLFISHDMAVVHHMCRRIAVMHHGSIVECGDREQVLLQPQHPYTKSLLRAVPAFSSPTAAA